MEDKLRWSFFLPADTFTPFQTDLRRYELTFLYLPEKQCYTCADCDSAGTDWLGTKEEVPGHAQTHAMMARWYEARILPEIKTQLIARFAWR